MSFILGARQCLIFMILASCFAYQFAEPMISMLKPASWFSEWIEFFKKDFGNNGKIDLKAFLLIDLVVSIILIPIAIIILFF